jgi:hypothetical protein
VRHVDGQGHQLGRFVAGVAEHQALVAGALFLVVVLGVVDAAGNIGRLRVDRREHAARVIVEADVRVDVADFLDRVARDLCGVDVRLGRHLAREDDLPGRHQRFAGDAALRVLRENRVEDGVGDLIGDLVRMTHGHRFTREQMRRATKIEGHYCLQSGGCLCCSKMPAARAIRGRETGFENVHPPPASCKSTF